MPQKRLHKTKEYAVTGVGYYVAGNLDKAAFQAQRAGRLRSDIWNKYGGLQTWGINADVLIKNFKKTHPPGLYGLDYEQWEKTFNRTIDELHTYQAAVKSLVVRRICEHFQPAELVIDDKGEVVKVLGVPVQVHPGEPNYRRELIAALNTREWMQYPLIARWLRQHYRRGHTQVRNQICVTSRPRAPIVKRISRNVVEVTINGELVGKKRYEKIALRFKVGRITPSGNLRIILLDGTAELHYTRIVNKVANSSELALGVDKGFTEAITDSNGTVYADGIGQIMTTEVEKRHVRGKARNKLYAIALNKNQPQIFKCNLGKNTWRRRETRKKAKLTNQVRASINTLFDSCGVVVTEDLSTAIKGKKRSPAMSRNLAEWCKGIIQTGLEEIANRRQSVVRLVNAAFSSQVDCRNGTLLGCRCGDSFLTFDGMRLQADHNAAVTLLHRDTDSEITRYMRVEKVHRILLDRTASFLAEMDLTLQDAVNLGWLDAKHLERRKQVKRG